MADLGQRVAESPEPVEQLARLVFLIGLASLVLQTANGRSLEIRLPASNMQRKISRERAIKQVNRREGSKQRHK
jgi:hypothetical protein